MLLGPVLTLINGPVLGEALKDPSNRLAKLVAAEKDDHRLIEEIYLAILARRPTADEVAKCLKTFNAAAKDHVEMAAEYGRLLAAVQAHEKLIPEKQAQWEKGFKNVVAWDPIEVKEAKAKVATLTKQADGSILPGGKNQGPETYTVTATTKATGITGIRLEVLADNGKGPGRAPNGNFVLHEFKATVAPANDPKAAKPVVFKLAVADFSQELFPVKNAIDGNLATGWAVAPQFGKTHIAVFETKEPLGFPAGTLLTITLEQHFQDKQHNIGRFRLSVTTAANPGGNLQGPPDATAHILAVEAAKRTPAQKTELTNFYRAQDGELLRLTQARNEYGAPPDKRLLGAQDVAWALINSPAFLFNH